MSAMGGGARADGDEASSTRTLTRLLGRAARVGGWLVIGGMAGVALLRGCHVENRTSEIAAVALTPWLLLPAWPLGTVAALRRRWLMAGVALALVICDAAWEGPVLWPLSHAPPAAAGATPWVLFDANIAQDNFAPREIGAEIVAKHPEVVSLEELTPPAVRFLRKTGALAGYHWSQVDARFGAGGMGLWARVPLTGVDTWISDGTQVEIQAWVHPRRTAPVRLDVVHVYAPIGADGPAEWQRQLGQVEAHLRVEARPLVVAGDFNATADLEPFQRILQLHLADAAVLAGKGWEMTWPRNQSWVLPYLRIDHVLLSPQLTVAAYQLGDGKGSDHHPLLVGIAAR